MPLLIKITLDSFENVENKDPGEGEDGGGGKGVVDGGDRGVGILSENLLKEYDKGSEVGGEKSGEVDNHPGNQEESLPSFQAHQGQEVDKEKNADGEHLQGHLNANFLWLLNHS